MQITDWDGLEVPVGPELALLRDGQQQLFLLNETGRQIWSHSRAGRSPDHSARMLADDYGICVRQARGDIDSLLQAWVEAGLLDAKPGPGEPGAATDREVSFAVTGQQAATSPGGRGYRLAGQSFFIDYRDPTIERLVHPVLAHLAEDGSAPDAVRLVVGSGRKGFTLDTGQRTLCQDSDPGLFAILMLREINVMAARCLKPALVLHAAAFGRDGRCLVLPGTGGRGKSTLAAAMALSGYEYLGDDMVAVEPWTHRLRPLRTSLNLKADSLPVLEKRYGVLAGVQGINAGSHRYRFLSPPGKMKPAADQRWDIEAMVFPRFRRGGPGRTRSLNGGEVLRGLVESTAAFMHQRGRGVMERLLNWLAHIPGYAMSYGSLEEGVLETERLFARLGAEGSGDQHNELDNW